MEPDDPGRGRHPSTTIVDLQSQPRAAEPAGAVASLQVEVIGGPMDGARTRVGKSELTIGRSEANDLSLPLDRMVSTAHARIFREGDHYWLEDLRSTNGTYLGDHRLQGRTLVGPGTIFMVGRTNLEFRSVIET